MLKVIIGSLFALVVVWFFADATGLTPQQVEDRMLLAQLNEEAGLAFRQHNAKRPGVIEMGGGLQVEILRQGEGDRPEFEDWISVHYQGSHVDGRLFESTYRLDLPGSVPISRTIPAWQKVLPQVETGTLLRLVVPPDMAYGIGGGGPIGPNETLIFEIELLAILSPPQVIERDALQQPVPGLQ